MIKEIIINFLKSDLFWTLAFIILGFIFSKLLGKLKEIIKKTPNSIDDDIFNFLVNDIFLKVEKDKLQEFISKFGFRFNGSKTSKAIDIFKLCWKEETGKDANKDILMKAKAVWAELATLQPIIKDDK